MFFHYSVKFELHILNLVSVLVVPGPFLGLVCMSRRACVRQMMSPYARCLPANVPVESVVGCIVRRSRVRTFKTPCRRCGPVQGAAPAVDTFCRQLSALLYSVFKEELKDEAQAEVEAGAVRGVVAAERHATAPGVVDPAAATVHAVGARGRTTGIGLR